jgi:hypothetical protein
VIHDLQADEWTDAADVASILFWEWQPHAGFEDEVVEYYEREMGPLFCQAPEILRLRWFKVSNASVLKGGSLSTLKSEDLHTYMCLVEMSCEDWPWGEVFAINELPGWGKYFEDQRRVVSLLALQDLGIRTNPRQKWQASQYVVKRSYGDAEVIDSNA